MNSHRHDYTVSSPNHWAISLVSNRGWRPYMLFNAYGHFACMLIFASYLSLVLFEARREHWTPWDWSYIQTVVSSCVGAGTKPSFSVLLTTEPSLQPHVSSLKALCSCLEAMQIFMDLRFLALHSASSDCEPLGSMTSTWTMWSRCITLRVMWPWHVTLELAVHEVSVPRLNGWLLL